MPELYRKRLIPSECIHLKNDTIVSFQTDILLPAGKHCIQRKNFPTEYPTMS